MNPDFNPNAYLNDEELAAYLGCDNVLALRYKREDGALPAPDTVFEGRAYWSPDTAREQYALMRLFVTHAFGHPPMDPSDAPDPLRHSGVTLIRWNEGRQDPPAYDPSDRFRGWV